MAATSIPRLAGASAPGLRLGAGLRVAVLAAVLAGAPGLAQTARAQRSASIRASAVITHSVVGVRLRHDTMATPPANPLERPVRIGELGTVDVVAGPEEEIRVARQLERDGDQATLVVQVDCVGS
jgi:hypothetical protein